MNLIFKKSFARDLKKRKRNKALLEIVQEIIQEAERAENIHNLNNLKKIRGEDRYYRIRIGDYRLGLIIEKDTVHFVRFLHRSEIYTYFP